MPLIDKAHRLQLFQKSAKRFVVLPIETLTNEAAIANAHTTATDLQLASNLAASRALRRALPNRSGSRSNGGGAESFSKLKLQLAKPAHAESGVAVGTKRMSLEIWSSLAAISKEILSAKGYSFWQIDN